MYNSWWLQWATLLFIRKYVFGGTINAQFQSLFCQNVYQCWSESGLVSPAVSPSPQDQSPSPSPSPSGQSPSPSGVSPSPLDQSPSPSPSPSDQSPSPSPSPVGQSPSPSPRVQQKSEWVRTWVRTQPGLMNLTIEKCFILTLLLIIFAEPCIDN